MCSGSGIIYLSWASCALLIIIVVFVVAFALDALVVASLKPWYRTLILCIRKIVYCRSLLYPLVLLVQAVCLGRGCVLTYYTVVHPTPDCTSLASDVTRTPRLSSSDDCSRGERTTSPFPNYSFRYFLKRGMGCFRFSSETHLLRGPLSSSFIHGADSLLGLLVLYVSFTKMAPKR